MNTAPLSPAAESTTHAAPAARRGRALATLLTRAMGVSALGLFALAVALWNPGRADAQNMVSTSRTYTAMTAQATSEELLYVLDGRAEEVFVYRTDVNKGTLLLARLSLPTAFTDARARAAGTPRR
jgi:hypothetical protein